MKWFEKAGFVVLAACVAVIAATAPAAAYYQDGWIVLDLLWWLRH